MSATVGEPLEQFVGREPKGFREEWDMVDILAVGTQPVSPLYDDFPPLPHQQDDFFAAML